MRCCGCTNRYCPCCGAPQVHRWWPPTVVYVEPPVPLPRKCPVVRRHDDVGAALRQARRALT